MDKETKWVKEQMFRKEKKEREYDKTQRKLGNEKIRFMSLKHYWYVIDLHWKFKLSIFNSSWENYISSIALRTDRQNDRRTHKLYSSFVPKKISTVSRNVLIFIKTTRADIVNVFVKKRNIPLCQEKTNKESNT